MSFDPDKYLSKKEKKSATTNGGFDPDAYLAKNEPIQEDEGVTLRGLLMGATETLPMIGGVGGGMLGAPLGPLGMGGGAALGAAGGKALENIIEAQFFDQPKTREEIYLDPAKEAAFEAATLGAAKAVKGAKGLLGKGYEMATKPFRQMAAPVKEGGEELIKAGKRIGVEPTRGMLTGESTIQRTESALAQSPTSPGQEVLKRLEDVDKGLLSAGEEALSIGKTPMTRIQMAETAKEAMQKGIKSRIEPAAQVYERIASETPYVDVAKKGMRAISRNIKNLPYAKIEGSAESTFAKQIGKNLEKIKSLDELRNLRSYVGKQLSDPNVPNTMKQTAGEIYGRLSRAEQRAITREAIKAARNAKHGKTVAGEMIKEIKDANKVYAAVSKDLQSLAKRVGMRRPKNYADFMRGLEDIPDEKFMDKFFNPNNLKGLKELQAQFPEAFDQMRKSRVADIYERSLTKGEISIPKLLNRVKRMTPESRKLIFGEGADQTLKDIETVYNATYKKLGPSGTPEGNVWMALKPTRYLTNWLNEWGDNAKKYMLDHPEQFQKMRQKYIDRLSREAVPMSRQGLIEQAAKERVKYGATPRLLRQTMQGEQSQEGQR